MSNDDSCHRVLDTNNLINSLVKELSKKLGYLLFTILEKLHLAGFLHSQKFTQLFFCCIMFFDFLFCLYFSSDHLAGERKSYYQGNYTKKGLKSSLGPHHCKKYSFLFAHLQSLKDSIQGNRQLFIQLQKKLCFSHLFQEYDFRFESLLAIKSGLSAI